MLRPDYGDRCEDSCGLDAKAIERMRDLRYSMLLNAFGTIHPPTSSAAAMRGILPLSAMVYETSPLYRLHQRRNAKESRAAKKERWCIVEKVASIFRRNERSEATEVS